MTPAAPRPSRRQWLALAGLVAGGTGLSWWLRGRAPLGQHVGNLAAARAVLADRDAPVMGAADGDLTVSVFTDYRCAACRAAYPGLMAAVRADGRVRVLVMDWPVFGDQSRRAARVALAAARQGRYGPVHDRLMTDRRALDDAVLADIVTQAGGDWARVQGDLTNHGAAIDARLAQTARQAFTLSAPGTPTYLIGPLLVIGALTEAEFTRAFAEARGG